MRWTVALVVAALATACGGDDPVEDDGAGGNGGTAGSGGMATGGAGAGGGSDPCLASWTDGVYGVDDGAGTQIHGTSAFDGEKIWVAYSRPDNLSSFDNMLVAFRCDGSVVVPPTEMTASADSELDPALAVYGDRLLAAWSSDNGNGGLDNLDIRYRIYALDGSPLTDVIELAATRNGAPVTGNALAPLLAATDGGWLLAGFWGHEDAPAFQGFVVSIDPAGTVMGDARDVELDPAATQTHVAVAHDAGGEQVVWQEDLTTTTTPTAWASTNGAAAVALGDPAGRPDVTAGPWLAWDGDGSDIVVRPPGGGDVGLGVTGFVHDASIASVDGQVAVAWMEIVSGIDNRIHVARLGATGELGAIRTLSTEDAPSVYPIDLTMVDGTHGVVVYQDGTSPNFELKAELFTLP